MTLNQESNAQSVFTQALLPSGWPDRKKGAVAAIRIIAALTVLAAFMILATYICSCGITRWNWLQLLIVPATIAGFGIWFNWSQKERDRKRDDQQKHLNEQQDKLQRDRDRDRELREARIKALQETKESVAYAAFLAKERRRGKVFEDEEFRAQFWPALCLSAVFESSDRAKTLIFLALKSVLDDPQDEDAIVIRRTLCEIKQTFDQLIQANEHYAKGGDKGPLDRKDKGPFDLKKHRRDLEALMDVLGLQDCA